MFDFELLVSKECLFQQAIHNQLAERKHQIETVNRNGGQYIREAKVRFLLSNQKLGFSLPFFSLTSFLPVFEFAYCTPHFILFCL